MTKEELVNKTLEELNKRYPRGLYEFLYRYRPDLYKNLIDIERRIDHIYLNPDSNPEQLKTVLKEYWTFHMRAIQIFKDRDTTDFDTKEIRQEMLDDRVRT